MPEPMPAHVGDLPVLGEVVPGWATDVVAAADTLFRRGLRILRDDDDGVLVFGDTAIRALARNTAAGATPPEFLTSRSAERLHRATPPSEDPTPRPTASPRRATPPSEVQTPPATAPRRATGEVSPAGVGAFDAFLRNQVFTMNAPLHARVRRVVSRHLMPRAVAGMAEHAERVMAEVLHEAARAGGPVDLGRDIAGPYVTRFWAHRLGMPVADAVRVQRLMHDMNLMFLLTPTPADRTRMLAATAAYMDVVGGTVIEALGRGGNPLLGDLAEGLESVDLPGRPTDLGALVAANFFDGFHTVAVALANAAYSLFMDPPSVERVRRDPSLVPAAFTEGMRLAAPLMFTTRLALSDVEHEGLHIPEGTPITMIWIAGNRDPETYDDPRAYRLERASHPGTTFGGGARICPGRNAARMLTEVALRALTAPELDVRLEPCTTGWVPGSAIRQRHAIPMAIQRTAAA